MDKCARTRTLIKKAFMEQYERCDYNSITIKGICTAIPIARTTFYTHYQNLDAVKDEIENDIISGLNAIIESYAHRDPDSATRAAFFDDVTSFIATNRRDFYTFAVAQPNLRFIEKWKKTIQQEFRILYPERSGSPNYDMVLEALPDAFMGAYTYWLKNSEAIDPDYLKEFVLKALHAIAGII